MKRFYRTLALVGMITLSQANGQQLTNQRALETTIAPMENDILTTLENEDAEELINATCNLRRLKTIAPWRNRERCIISLMHVLNDERHDPRARIIAAGMLHELRSDRADFAISRNALFADEVHVQRYCAMLSRNRSIEKTGAFASR
jgi:hypothetical protein